MDFRKENIVQLILLRVKVILHICNRVVVPGKEDIDRDDEKGLDNAVLRHGRIRRNHCESHYEQSCAVDDAVVNEKEEHPGDQGTSSLLTFVPVPMQPFHANLDGQAVYGKEDDANKWIDDQELDAHGDLKNYHDENVAA